MRNTQWTYEGSADWQRCVALACFGTSCGMATIHLREPNVMLARQESMNFVVPKGPVNLIGTDCERLMMMSMCLTFVYVCFVIYIYIYMDIAL